MEFRPRYRRSLSHGMYHDSIVKGDFRGGLAIQANCSEMTFESCQMDQINFSGSKFKDCLFLHCSMPGANFNATTLDGCTFQGCNLDMAGFRASSIWGTNFIDGRAEYASFEEALIRDVTFDTQLHGADLRFSSARNLDMGDSNLWGAANNWSCRNYKNVRFSVRQVEIILALIAKTAGNEELRTSIKSLVSAKMARVVDTLVDAEEAE